MRDSSDTPEILVITTNQIFLASVVLILTAALFIGALTTPWVNGVPLVLTRENLQVKTYLDQYAQRLGAMEKEHKDLKVLLTTQRPASVFSSSERARTALANLEALAREVERTRIPRGLAPLDNALRDALAAELNFADKTLEFIGKADDLSKQTALASAEDAESKTTLARQQVGAIQ
jgi:hypothetical protein